MYDRRALCYFKISHVFFSFRSNFSVYIEGSITSTVYRTRRWCGLLNVSAFFTLERFYSCTGCAWFLQRQNKSKTVYSVIKPLISVLVNILKTVTKPVYHQYFTCLAISHFVFDCFRFEWWAYKSNPVICAKNLGLFVPKLGNKETKGVSIVYTILLFPSTCLNNT